MARCWNVRQYPFELYPCLNTFSDDIGSRRLIPCVDFGKACDIVRVIDIPKSSTSSSTPLFLGLTCSATLLSATSSSPPRTLAQNVNSFTVSGDFVVYTTLAHEAHFVSASLLAAVDASADVGGERRRVERGSRIVTSVPSTMSLVLQMPRGNLETVNPRPMVMATIHADTDAYVWFCPRDCIALMSDNKGKLPQGLLDVQKAPYRSQRHRRQGLKAFQGALTFFH